ncbi:uncharacterized protein K444DRAFT_667850 [Hyaloscypha bicolor E]|uniref:N-acetyltransferase domain-containing protein n=1 Tax=Hyaloscypha bicolor E TaxID=1095630 RepID=A0A2J6SU27_9HELO|nr:uncharacterized protein K444DRAFT_667850 [Hyaloscypha bicolor E]PMD54260.1 hypothetical protein K444DRAFT_667850 [Hyaloscypha bicolor E]
MPLQFQEADFKDGKAIANVCISAFFDDPFQKSLYPGKPFDKQVAGVISRWPNNYGDISAHYKVVVDTDTSEVVSYLKSGLSICEPETRLTPTGLPENFKPVRSSTPKGLNDPFATDFTKKRRGCASLHLSWTTELAEEKGLTCWVEASPMSVALYKKFGFEIQNTIVVQLDESCGGGTQTSSCMMREPRK